MVFVTAAVLTLLRSVAAYEPTWESLDKRVAPSWFLDEKVYFDLVEYFYTLHCLRDISLFSALR